MQPDLRVLNSSDSDKSDPYLFQRPQADIDTLRATITLCIRLLYRGAGVFKHET